MEGVAVIWSGGKFVEELSRVSMLATEHVPGWGGRWVNNRDEVAFHLPGCSISRMVEWSGR